MFHIPHLVTCDRLSRWAHLHGGQELCLVNDVSPWKAKQTTNIKQWTFLWEFLGDAAGWEFNRHMNHLDHLVVFTSKGSQIKRFPNWQKNYTQNKLRAEEGAEIRHYRSNMWTQPWHSFTVAIWVYERYWALVIFTEKAFQPVFYHTFRFLPTKTLNMNHHNSCFLCDISVSIFHQAETICPTITSGFTHWWQVHRSWCRFLRPR